MRGRTPALLLVVLSALFVVKPTTALAARSPSTPRPPARPRFPVEAPESLVARLAKPVSRASIDTDVAPTYRDETCVEECTEAPTWETCRVDDRLPRRDEWGKGTTAEQAATIRAMLEVFAREKPDYDVALASYAIGFTESGFNPGAYRSDTDVYGLHQLKPLVWRFYADRKVADDEEARFDPRENARAGLRFHQHLYQRWVKDRVAELTGRERVEETYYLLYSLHNYGETDPRGLEAGETIREIAGRHVALMWSLHEALESWRQPPVRRRPVVRKRTVMARKAPARPVARATTARKAPVRPKAAKAAVGARKARS